LSAYKNEFFRKLLKILEETRIAYDFVVVGYVAMPG